MASLVGGVVIQRAGGTRNLRLHDTYRVRCYGSHDGRYEMQASGHTITVCWHTTTATGVKAGSKEGWSDAKAPKIDVLILETRLEQV